MKAIRQISGGKAQFVPSMTPQEIREADDNCEGFCLGCGEVQEGCEPDMHEGECENCGSCEVYGIEELAIMGLLIVDENTQEAA
jgi:hypothetical protein